VKDFLEGLIQNKNRESDILEYKKRDFTDGKFNSLNQELANKLLKVICSFANSNGGKIVLGIEEDEKHNPKGFCDVGVSREQFEMWEQSFRSKIATQTMPVLYGIQVYHEIIDEKNIILIVVPRSAIKPHAFHTGSRDEFYIRNGNQSLLMRYNDLKNSFQALEYTQRKIHEFRDQRISFILNGDLDASLPTDTSLVIHVVPEWSLDEANFLDLRKCRNNQDFINISPSTLGSPIFNSDGLLNVHDNGNRSYSSYVQIFTNGSIEAVEVRLMNDYRDRTICNWHKIEKDVVQRIFSYCKGLSKLGVTPTFHISISLLNTKGKKAIIDSFGDTSSNLKINIVKTPFVKWSDDSSFPEAMFPILTTLAHTFGLSKSSFYDKQLHPIADKFKFLEEGFSRDTSTGSH